MWAFICGISGNCWVAWGAAGTFLVIALCSIFRTPLGIEGCMLWLMVKTVGLQEVVIRDQAALLENRERLIATLERQLMLEDIIPWNDADEPDE